MKKFTIKDIATIKLSTIIIYLISISITFYIVKITQLSPIYIIFIGLIPFFIINLINIRYVSCSTDTKAILFLFLYIIITQIEFVNTGDFVNLFISLLAYLYIRLIKNLHDINFYIKIIRYLIRIAIVTISLDSFYRIMNPMVPNMDEFESYAQSENMWIYIYKSNSIMFAHSNATALIIIILFFTIVSLQIISKQNYKYEKLALIFLLIFTFSRTAYLTFIFCISIFYLNKKNIKIRIIFFFIISFMTIIFAFVFNTYFENDGSFNSKFDILNNTYKSLQESSLIELLFGIGLGNSRYLLGIDAHLFFLKYLIESGVFGLNIVIIFIIIYIYKYNYIVLLPVLILGLSYFMYLGTPFLFVPLALLANIYDLKKGNKTCIKI